METLQIDNIEQVIELIKGKDPKYSVYDHVYYKHPLKTNNKIIETTIGRIIFNLMLPDDYPYINEPIDSKKLRKILFDISKKYDKETFAETVHKIQKYSLELSAKVSATIEISKLVLPESIRKEKEQLTKDAENLTPVEFDKKLDDLYYKLQDELEKQKVTFFDLVKSGTKGKKSDLQQLFLAWGPAYQPLSDDMPIISHSLLEGMKPEELYYGANKARYAAYLKSINVAPIGYLSRKLRWALNNVKLSETIEDCGTTKYFEIIVNEQISKLILGRYYYDNTQNKLVLIDENNIRDLIGKKIKLRSPLYCQAKDGICKVCYGELAKLLKNRDIGLTASGAIYVRTLNKGMKLSHQKLTAKQEVNFVEEIKKWYS